MSAGVSWTDDRWHLFIKSARWTNISHTDFIKLHYFLKLDESRLFRVGQDHTCMKHLRTDGPAHLHFVFKLHSAIKTSKAAMMLAHPSGWNQTRELWLTLLRSANNLFQQIEVKLPLIDRKTGERFIFCVFAHQALRSIMLQETSGLKQRRGLNDAQANAEPVSSDASSAAAAKCGNHLCNQKPRVVWRARKGLGWKGLALPSRGGVGGSKQLETACWMCVTSALQLANERGACLNHNISACSITGKW